MQHVHTLLLRGLLLFLMPFGVLMAQTTPSAQPFCGTPSISPTAALSLVQQANLALQRKRASGATFTTVTYVPIRPHIFRRSDGSGGLDLATLNQVMALTNSHYLLNGFGIQFYFAGSTPDYIDNDLYYNYDGTQPINLDATNAMNQYYVNQFSGSLGMYSGFAYYPGDYLESTRSYIRARSGEQIDYVGKYLIPHELGHNFNLAHTFGFGNGSVPTDELVTRGPGANCTVAGDFICDTPADPFGMFDYGYRIDNDGCAVYTGTSVDANGEPFAPETNNLMGYNQHSCPYHFTPGQYDRMQAGLALRQSHTTYTLDAPPTNVAAPGNLNGSFSVGAVTLTWQDNASNEMGYFIERSTSPNSGFVAIGGVAPNVTTFTDTKYTPQTTYYYRIRPSNTTTGSLSPTTEVSTASPPIGGLATTNITQTRIRRK